MVAVSADTRPGADEAVKPEKAADKLWPSRRKRLQEGGGATTPRA
jgi:hypothetical protein